MCSGISFFNLGNVAGLQNVSLLKAKSKADVAENNKLLPQNNQDDRDIKEMVYFIRLCENKSKLPTYEEIYKKFQQREIDPRKLKKGDEITLNLGGENYTFKIEKDGEFFCKVKGRDDSVRIYQGKNIKGEDCICFEHHYKKTECNIYLTFKNRIPVELFDNIKK